MIGNSSYLWSEGGVFWFHSIAVFKCDENKIWRWEDNLSQIINIKYNTLVKEIIDPIDEITFHVKNASGKSEYRRGIPFSPRKCCGKNVILTPMNIIINWIFIHKLFIVSPVNRGYQ